MCPMYFTPTELIPLFIALAMLVIFLSCVVINVCGLIDSKMAVVNLPISTTISPPPSVKDAKLSDKLRMSILVEFEDNGKLILRRKVETISLGKSLIMYDTCHDPKLQKLMRNTISCTTSWILFVFLLYIFFVLVKQINMFFSSKIKDH